MTYNVDLAIRALPGCMEEGEGGADGLPRPHRSMGHVPLCGAVLDKF